MLKLRGAFTPWAELGGEGRTLASWGFWCLWCLSPGLKDPSCQYVNLVSFNESSFTSSYKETKLNGHAPSLRALTEYLLLCRVLH